MSNIIDYLRSYGQYTLEEKEFNSVDSLVLSQFAYLKFDGLVPEPFEKKNGVKLLDILVHPERNRMFMDERYEKANRGLFEAMVFSKRYQNMKLNHYAMRTDTETETQFCAITFCLDGDLTFVAYRGTDETLVGWKEDLNMTFLCPVPSQRYAVEYLNAVGSKIKTPFIVGGHSKGGNLAVYASLKCEKKVKEKIKAIYNNDGPGFRKEVFEDGEYDKLSERIVKTVPQSSFFGMLLQDEKECQVIRSSGVGGIGQHDPYTWEVEEGAFILVDGIFKNQQRVNNNLNDWVSQLNEEELKIFATTLFEVIGATEADTVIELTEEWKNNRVKMVHAFKDIDSETKKKILEIISILFTRGRLSKLEKKKPEIAKRPIEVEMEASEEFEPGKIWLLEGEEGAKEIKEFGKIKELVKKPSKVLERIKNSKVAKKGMTAVNVRKK